MRDVEVKVGWTEVIVGHKKGYSLAESIAYSLPVCFIQQWPLIPSRITVEYSHFYWPSIWHQSLHSTTTIKRPDCRIPNGGCHFCNLLGSISIQFPRIFLLFLVFRMLLN